MSNDGVSLDRNRIIEMDIVTEDLSVAAESLPPKAIAQQNDVFVARPVLIFCE
jgi:hypothetical protein